MGQEATPQRRPGLLLVEDDPKLATTLARALYDRGFQVTIARNIGEVPRDVEPVVERPE